MPIKVTATCAWCNVIKETTIQNPIPKDWITEDVKCPNWPISVATVSENFCGEEHLRHYQYYSPQAHDQASFDYTQKFYSAMNVLREKESKEPRSRTETLPEVKD